MKFTDKELEEMRPVARTYQERIESDHDAAYKKLPKQFRDFADDLEDNTRESKLFNEMKAAFEEDPNVKPSDFIRENMAPLFEAYIPDVYLEYILYAADNCRDWAYEQRSIARRSFRTSHLESVTEQVFYALRDYGINTRVPVSVSDYLLDNMTDEQLAYKYCFHARIWDDIGLAAEIDGGNEQLIELIRDVIDGESEVELEHFIIRGVLKSHNQELHTLLGKLLLAARLQEGLRQAICECADCGTIQGFKTIIHVIADNDLIRYSSVKRAVGTWMGMFPDPYMVRAKDVERISGKTIDLIMDCLEDEEKREEYLQSEDSMKIFVALWNMGIYEAEDAADRIEKMSREGTTHQILTAGYMNANFCKATLSGRIAKSIIKEHFGEQDILAMYLPEFMGNVGQDMRNMLRNGRYLPDGSYDYSKRVYVDLESYFENETEAKEYYDLFKTIYEGINGKKAEFSPCIFPWNSALLLKSDILLRMAYIASGLKDNDKIDEIAEHITEIDSQNGDRNVVVQLLLTQPETKLQTKVLMNCVSDKESITRNIAYAIAKSMNLGVESYKQLEGMLKSKNSEIREHIIALLYQEEDEALQGTITRLLKDKKEEKRTAGLDLILQLMADENRQKLFKRCREEVAITDKTTTKEQILMEQILAKTEETEENSFYDLNVEYHPTLDQSYLTECEAVVDAYFKKAAVTNGRCDFDLAWDELISLVNDHKDDEISISGETMLLSQARWIYRSSTDEIILQTLWDSFYEETLHGDYRLVYRLYLAFLSEGEHDAQAKAASELIRKYIGDEYSHGEMRKFFPIISDVLKYYFDKYVPLQDREAIATWIAGKLIEETAPLFVTHKKKIFGEEREVVISLAQNYQLGLLLNGLSENTNQGTHEKLGEIFPIRYLLQHKEHFTEHNYFSDRMFHLYGLDDFKTLDVIDYLLAANKGIISTDFMYKVLFAEDEDLYQISGITLSASLKTVSNLMIKIRESEKNIVTRNHFSSYRFVSALRRLIGSKSIGEIDEADQQLFSFIETVYANLMKVVLDVELKRGDTETKYSKGAGSIDRIYGIEYFVRILSALGKETLERSTYGSMMDTSKRCILSHLLSVCIPDEEDTLDVLRGALKETDITEARLVEAAMYSPEWMNLVESYLGWSGFAEACYYFIAHTNEKIDAKKMAVIARYSPLTDEEFMNGAFDVNWFRRSYEALGKKRFDLLYKAAKYISDGAKHTRARKYADAASGKLKAEEVKEQVAAKRNKDLLMAYGIIPLDNDQDLLERYLYLEQFLKESRKFGAQRAASEKSAVETAKKNLSITVGMEDVTRLTLKMESALMERNRELLQDHEIDEITVRIEIDEDGKAEIICTKAGKALKNIPAKYKKNEYIILLNETKKHFKEQHSRSIRMFEQAMEDEVEYTGEELMNLMANPIMKPIISRLVYGFRNENESVVPAGFLEETESGLMHIDVSGSTHVLTKDDRVVILHPYVLYREGSWSLYQAEVFKREMKQPFKQIFRELYVKTKDEIDAEYSRRYSGYQIQPKKTAAVLKSRRWIADVEEGLQKVYYKENMIARIYARADWFTPSEIEAPAIEWVEFYDRKTEKRIPLKEIPESIFSEVMRDVDLAVSTAYVGGVDPESSHSTIEMREALIKLTLPLFKISNVEIKGNHAHIKGTRAEYTVHLGSGVVHQKGGTMLSILPVHSGQRGRVFLPFADEDPKTAEVLTKILMLADDAKLKDPTILRQIR